MSTEAAVNYSKRHPLTGGNSRVFFNFTPPQFGGGKKSVIVPSQFGGGRGKKNPKLFLVLLGLAWWQEQTLPTKASVTNTNKHS